MYLGWYDDNPKHTTAQKIAEACQAYTERFGVRPNLVLVNRDELCEVAGITVRSEGYIRRNNYWVAREG
jgi:hypothetical protein